MDHSFGVYYAMIILKGPPEEYQNRIGSYDKAPILLLLLRAYYMGVSENRGPKYGTLNSRILILRTPKNKEPPRFSKSPISTGRRQQFRV